MKEVVEKVTTRLLSMLDPTGVMAVINSAIAFFDTIRSAIEYIREILDIVDRYVSTIAAVAQGNIGPGAAMLESGLAAAVPVALGFLANLLHLDDVPEKIREIILGLRELIDQAIDWLFDQAMALGKAALDALGLGGEDEDPNPAALDPEDEMIPVSQGFDMYGTGHTLSVVQNGSKFELMMASSPGVLLGRVYYAMNDPKTPDTVKS